MGKTMKRITAFMLALAVLITTVNWSFVKEETEAGVNASSGANSTQSETGASGNSEIPVYTFPLEVELDDKQEEPQVIEEVEQTPDWTLTYENEEVKVTVSGAEGVVPEGTTVKVTPILADDADTQSQYEEIAAQLQGKAENESYNILGFLAYDITLIDPEGNKIEPTSDVKVSLEYIKATLPEAVASSDVANPNVTVMHLEEDENGEVKDVVDLKTVDFGSDILTLNQIQDLQVTEERAIEKAEFVTDSFSTFTVTWTNNPDPNYTWNVHIVINGTDHWNQTNNNKPAGLRDANYTYTRENTDQVDAQNLFDAIKNDSLIQGSKLEGMQIGLYDPDGPWISGLSYNNGWVYAPIGGNWTNLDEYVGFDANDPIISLVLSSYLEVHVVDINGNPIQLNVDANNIDDFVDEDGRHVAFYDWKAGEGIYYLRFADGSGNATGNPAQVNGSNIRGTDIANAIKANTTLNSYQYVGMTLDAYAAGTTLNEWQVSYNSFADDGPWCYNNNGWKHWTTPGDVYPKMYLVYDVPDTTEKTLHVKAYDAEKGTVIQQYDIVFTGSTSRSLSTLSDQMISVDPALFADYDYIGGGQAGEYVYGPTGEQWIYSVAYSSINGWQYTDSDADNAALKEWFKGANEATVSLIYDKKDEDGGLTRVDTLYNTGIKMQLFNYTASAENILSSETTGKLGGANYDGGDLKQGVLQPVLGTDGFPVTADTDEANGNGEAGLSLAPLFSGEYGKGYDKGTGKVEPQGDVDGLFIAETFEDTGYYHYSSFENYAYYDGWEFFVYKELGTPEDTDLDNRFYFNRGNFMPFNAIKEGEIAKKSRNWYNSDGSLMDPSNPRYGETLYMTQGIDYWFGMYVEAEFYKPEDGLVKNPETENMDNMIYYFNGDDDLWIYVDNVLLLDLGGVHDAHDGQIDFATGIITWTNCKSTEQPKTYTTTIKAQYEAAKIFPDGTAWDDNRVDEYFEGDTYKDYTTHVLKMFYMERGTGASNLEMTFNIQVVPDKTLEISKALNGDDENRYADEVEFAFQLWAQDIDPNYSDDAHYLNTLSPIEWKDAIYKGTTTSVPYKDKVTIKDVVYENVFYIKPGEVIQFTGFPENRQYQIVEIGLEDDKYGDAYFNGNPALDVTDSSLGEGIVIGQGSQRAVAGATPVVAITNTCITGDFEITKKMKEGQTSTDTFSFKVWVEDLNETLIPYVGNYYVNGSETPLTTNDGIISGVKVDDKIVLKAFFAGTHFYVEELEYTDKYLTPQKESTNKVVGTKPITGLDGKETVTPDGVVTGEANGDGANPIVTLTVTNEYKPSVTVTKTWNDVQDRSRDGIYVGLYETVDNNGVMEERYAGKDPGLLNADNNWTHTWQYVENSKTYLVKELRLAQDGETTGIVSIGGQDYVPVAEGQSVVVSSVKYNVDYSEKTDTKDANGGAVEAFTVTNTIVWNIVKTGIGSDLMNEKTAPLAGATFVLINNDDTTIKYNGLSRTNDGIIEWTKEDGTAVTTIPDGTYTFQEVKAPTGYLLNTDTWTITVENGVPKTVQVAEDGTGTPTTATGTIDTTTHELVFEFHNSPMYSLPSSGTFGIFGYVAGGIIIMLAAVLLVFKSSGKHSVLEK